MKPKNLTKIEIKNLLKEYTDIIKKFKIKKIGVFGSYIRGEQKKSSDIDILIEFDDTAFDNNFKGYSDNYMELQSTLKKIFGRKIDLLTIEMISPYIKPYILKEVEYV